MKISVIFPTYQRVHDLERALDSLLEQTLLPFETIVVDQSDDEETKKLCNKDIYINQLNMKYLYSDCKSPPKAKQIGMEHLSLKTDAFVFFDDDVKLEPNYLEEVANFFMSHPNAL
jgi:glycosyltransferase involved in cell wall biosynthesis